MLIGAGVREGASFITSQSELGVIGGCRGGGGVAQIRGFFRLSPIWSWKKPRCQRGLFGARFRSFWVSGFLDVQRKSRPPLMLLMLAWACRLMLLMLVVSWPRSACVSNILALGMLPHVCLSVCLSMFGGKLVCWVKTCLTCPSLCLARCSHVGTKPLLLTCCVGAPARVVLCNSRSTTMRACSFSFVTMAASVRGNLKLGISEFRCVANPAPARAFVPARGSQVSCS